MDTKVDDQMKNSQTAKSAWTTDDLRIAINDITDSAASGSKETIKVVADAEEVEGLIWKGKRKQFTTQMKNLIDKNSRDLENLREDYPLQYLFVIDFECNQPGCEIIEFPVIVVNLMQRVICETFHSFVRPTISPTIPAFITGLTNISQQMVQSSRTIREVLQNVESFLSKYPPQFSAVLYDCDNDSRFLGDEIRNQAINLTRDTHFLSFINLRNIFPISLTGGIANSSLNHSLDVLQMKFFGQRHKGRDDATNIARVCIELVNRGLQFTRFMMQSQFVKDQPRTCVKPRVKDIFELSQFLIAVDMPKTPSTSILTVHEFCSEFNLCLFSKKSATIIKQESLESISPSSIPSLNQQPESRQYSLLSSFEIKFIDGNKQIEDSFILISKLQELMSTHGLQSSNTVIVVNGTAQEGNRYQKFLSHLTKLFKQPKGALIFKKKTLSIYHLLFMLEKEEVKPIPIINDSLGFPANILDFVGQVVPIDPLSQRKKLVLKSRPTFNPDAASIRRSDQKQVIDKTLHLSKQLVLDQVAFPLLQQKQTDTENCSLQQQTRSKLEGEENKEKQKKTRKHNRPKKNKQKAGGGIGCDEHDNVTKLDILQKDLTSQSNSS